MTHQCRQRIQASTASSVLACHFESVDLEHANDVIDFLFGESISEVEAAAAAAATVAAVAASNAVAAAIRAAAAAEQVSNNVLLDISPMSLMALLFDVIHHGLEHQAAAFKDL